MSQEKPLRPVRAKSPWVHDMEAGVYLKRKAG